MAVRSVYLQAFILFLFSFLFLQWNFLRNLENETTRCILDKKKKDPSSEKCSPLFYRLSCDDFICHVMEKTSVLLSLSPFGRIGKNVLYIRASGNNIRKWSLLAKRKKE